ncbi:MAG: DDE-type integrase/transposase/recombinase [Clostridiales bacterium]|nr:DDE-type integrase/transposase/recombinase [Clostridiales bacterium]
MVKYRNNIVEQDHRRIKGVMKPLGFKTFRFAFATISSIEIMNMLHRQQAGQMSPREEVAFINHVMIAC